MEVNQEVETFVHVVSDGMLDGSENAGMHAGARRARARRLSERHRQPMEDFSMALKQSICGHVEYYYVSDLYLSTCIKELEEMTRIIDSRVYDSLPWQAEPTTGLWWRHLVAGGLAGAVSRTSTAPLDRLKLMLMVYGSRANNLRISSTFTGMLKEGGLPSLWRGNGMNIAKVMPEVALKFAAYEQIKCLIKAGCGGNRELGMADRFVAGSLAGVLSQSVIYPLEVLKTRLVLRKTGQYKGAWDCVRQMFTREGVRGFYRGYVPNTLGIIPYAGIDLAVYETLKKTYQSRMSTTDEPATAILLSCGIISSTMGQLASYPLSLVRTRLQAQVAVDGPCTSMGGVFRTIVTNDGVTGLYRGLTANFLKVAPAVGISYAVYEHARVALGVKMT